MNTRRTLIILLLIVLGLVMAYNLLMVPLINQQPYQMGMHGMSRHWTTYPNYSMYGDFRILSLLVLMMIAAILLFDLLRPSPNQPRRCKNCGYELKPDWKICPICGRTVSSGGRSEK